jgi:hypothetical protein
MLNRDVINTTIGKGFADLMDEKVMDISPSLSYTRREMVEDLGCANFIAASRLANVLKKLKIVTPLQLARTDPFSLVRTRGIGVTAMFVAMCILDANRYDPVKWWGWKGNETKFSSLKHTAIRRAKKHTQEV